MQIIFFVTFHEPIKKCIMMGLFKEKRKLTSIFSSSSCKNSPSVATLVIKVEPFAHTIARDKYSTRCDKLKSVLENKKRKKHNFTIKDNKQ